MPIPLLLGGLIGVLASDGDGSIPALSTEPPSPFDISDALPSDIFGTIFGKVDGEVGSILSDFEEMWREIVYQLFGIEPATKTVKAT